MWGHLDVVKATITRRWRFICIYTSGRNLKTLKILCINRLRLWFVVVASTQWFNTVLSVFPQSLKSCGYVKEQFAWRHFYWYLTNEGIQYLRDFLHLPPEIVPATLRRQTRPEAARPRPKGKCPCVHVVWLWSVVLFLKSQYHIRQNTGSDNFTHTVILGLLCSEDIEVIVHWW